MSIINFPILYVPNPAKGKPLFYGQIYVGEPGLDPTVEINQKQLNIVQEDGSVVPVPQPFILSVGGVPVYNGATVRLDVEGNYSLKILDKNGAQTQYYIDNVYEGEPVTVEALLELVDDILINDLSQTINLSVAQYKALTKELPVGKKVYVTDRDADFSVIAGTGTANNMDIIASDQVSQSLDLIISNPELLTPIQLGAIYDGVTNNTTSEQRRYELLEEIATSGDESLVESPVVVGGESGKRAVTWSGASGEVMFSLSDYDRLSDLIIESKSSLSTTSNLSGKNNVIRDVEFKIDGVDDPLLHIGNCVYLREGCEGALIKDNIFDKTRYQIIQASGEKVEKVIITNNIANDCVNDFVLQNNDFDNGLSHAWLVSNNIVDQTNSTEVYGATECRGIGFTSCYGGMAINNAMIAVRGDAATHLENIQETSFAFNYYRDNHKDVLFSGETDRKLIRLNVTVGAVAVDQNITDSVTGATGKVQFWIGNNIAQVINITGGAFGNGNAFTTSGGASGSIVYVDAVQSRANLIGNIFHKTNEDSTDSISSSGGPYTLRNFCLGNTWNNQGLITNKKALAVSARFDVSAMFSSFSGWDRAINGGGGTANDHDLAFNKYWGNTHNVWGNIFNHFTWFRERFYDGLFLAPDLQDSELEGCEFHAGEINIQSSTNDNSWINNKVDSGVTITNLSVLDFTKWESIAFSKNVRCNKITRTNIAPSSGTPTVLATLTPRDGETSVMIQSLFSFRNNGADRYGGGSERMQVIWSPTEVPTITLDANNFNPDGGVTIEAVDVGSGVVEVRALGDTASGWLADLETTIIESGVNVEPDVYIDTL